MCRAQLLPHPEFEPVRVLPSRPDAASAVSGASVAFSSVAVSSCAPSSYSVSSFAFPSVAASAVAISSRTAAAVHMCAAAVTPAF